MKRFLVLSICMAFARAGSAVTVTSFSGFYQNGQVFFTWTLDDSLGSIYKLYRSSVPITSGSQLASCEYLGITRRSSSLNNNLTDHDCQSKYWIIKPGQLPLSDSDGLFVTNCVANASYYYAITVTLAGVEDQTVIPGENSLTAPIAETIADPQPILQDTRLIDGETVQVWGDFFCAQDSLNGPLMMKAGWLGFDFAIYLNPTAASPHPLHIRFHPGGSDFLNKITLANHGEINLGIEDYLPDEDNTVWLGSNPDFDPFDMSNNSPPLSGINYFYSLKRLLREIKWVEANYDVDTNLVYAEGNSFGSNGCFAMLLLHPELFAAVDLTGGMFNFGFIADYDPNCSMNTGKKNRISGDKLFGSVNTNLPVSGYAYNTYDMLNGGFMINRYNENLYPVIYSINGKYDNVMGWREKPIWYDSVNNNHLGGYFFYDERDHGGDGRFWSSSNYDMFRYARNVSYPAFSNCSLNGNPGDGHINDGDSAGTINGFLDWKTKAADIVDQPTLWQIQLYLKDLVQQSDSLTLAPDSATADVTPRRLQQFHPWPGCLLRWTVTHLNDTVQSGAQVYSGPGLFTIPSVIILKDTCLFSVEAVPADTFYADADQDGYGDVNNYTIAETLPAGYVVDHSDCNDSISAVHPGAAEVCNGIDDNCDGQIDENTFAATITPSGALSACESVPVVLSGDSVSGYSYQWYLNDVPINGATNKDFTSAGNRYAIYYVKETTPDGCTAISPATKIIRIQAPPAVIADMATSSISVLDSVTLKATYATAVHWQWNKDLSIISGATNQDYTAVEDGDYTVTVTNNSGCAATSRIVTVVITMLSGSDEITNDWFVSVFPNPAINETTLRVSMNDGLQSDLRIDIANSLGQLMKSENHKPANQVMQVEMDLAGYPPGQYFIRLVTVQKTIVLPLMVE